MPKLEPYNRKLPYSYCLGVFPCHKLLDAGSEHVSRLLLSSEGMQSEGIAYLRQRCASLGIREEIADRVLRRESQKDNCFAGLVFEKYQSKLNGDAPHVVLCQISDGGNLGTALRACLGFGMRDIAIIKPCVDAFDPHVLRASMGAFYSMHVHTYDSFDEYRSEFPEHTLYPFMLDAAVELQDGIRDMTENRRLPFSLVFGNEASGLPKEFSTYGQSVIIPQSKEIDSLNLSVSVAIGTFEFMNAYRKL